MFVRSDFLLEKQGVSGGGGYRFRREKPTATKQRYPAYWLSSNVVGVGLQNSPDSTQTGLKNSPDSTQVRMAVPPLNTAAADGIALT